MMQKLPENYGATPATAVIPAQAGIQVVTRAKRINAVLHTDCYVLDSGLRRNDDNGWDAPVLKQFL